MDWKQMKATLLLLSVVLTLWTAQGAVPSVSTSEVALSSPQLKWLFGGFGFQNAEAQLGALMTDEFRDERALKCFRELDPSFARVYTGQWDASPAALDRFADYYDRTFRPAMTTLYATVGPMPQMPGGLDPDEYAEKVAKALEYLVKVRKCVKLRYYCLTNEMMFGDKWGWFDAPENHALYRRYCEALYRAFHRHGLAIDLVTTDGSYCRETAKHLQWAVDELNDLTGLYCTHYYDQMEPGNQNNYGICLKEYTGAVQLTITKGKRWMLGEFGVCAMNPVREEGVMLDDRNYNMRDEKASETTALNTAEMAVAAINAGAYAVLSWSFCDYPDPFPIVDGDTPEEHARFESARLVYKADVKYNKWGMFRWVDAKRDYRAYPTYYALGYFAKLFRSGASVLPSATDDKSLRVTTVENTDGSVSSAVINWGEEKDVRLSGVPLPAKPFRVYRYEAASVPYNAFNDLQPPSETVVAKDGALVVRLPAKSLAFVTTDYVDRVPSAVVGMKQTTDGILAWEASRDAEHRYYRIFEDGRQVASTVATQWKGARAGRKYEVKSVDHWGNVK